MAIKYWEPTLGCLYHESKGEWGGVTVESGKGEDKRRGERNVLRFNCHGLTQMAAQKIGENHARNILHLEIK